MKRLISIILIISMIFALVSCGMDDSEKRALADKFMESFATGNYSRMMNFEMTEEVSSSVSEDILDEFWNNYLMDQFGRFVEYEGYLTQMESGNVTMYMYGLKFEGYEVIMAVGVNGKGEIASFTLAQAVSGAKEEFSEGVSVKEVSFGNEPYVINGSLISKEGTENAPAVIIVGGSGPTDRYGKMGANATYADLADELAKKGITVLTFDKRTYTYAQTITDEELLSFTIEDEYLEDVKAAYEYLKGCEGIDQEEIYIAGHSLGGYLLPMIDGYLSGAPKGYIYLSAPSDNMQTLMLYQVRYLANLDGEVDEEEAFQIEAYELMAKNVRNLTEENKGSYSYTDLFSSPPSYWLSLKDYNAPESSVDVSSKMFFAFGGKDYQVPLYQMEAYETALQGREDVTFKIYDNMCHLLFDTNTYEKDLSPDDYNVKTDINAELVNDIYEFIVK